MKIVISQPMLFPWVGLLEQVRQSDVFVHYSDVQFSKGSFTNRVQIKTAQGSRWLSVPLSGLSLGQSIDQVRLDRQRGWRRQHRALLEQAYAAAPFRGDMLALVDEVYAVGCTTIAELSEHSLLAVCRYFGLDNGTRFLDAAALGVPGAGSQRVLGIVRALGGDRYITGLGARHYLDHEVFERAGVSVEYMNYRRLPYPQLHGDFTPYVSSLDLVANCGKRGVNYLQSGTLAWREFLQHE
ncbi:MAG: WbqC family protein [Gammaproteobacteria bacterium]|nr:WbqC family protein [Gammaproteobacteria bacterium]MBU0884927.1 WbqC family protein [Gammaproteobacteria bacterium]MBU1859547.1 WbqC family protein [Gammaproteobacteria bacterium]